MFVGGSLAPRGLCARCLIHTAVQLGNPDVGFAGLGSLAGTFPDVSCRTARLAGRRFAPPAGHLSG